MKLYGVIYAKRTTNSEDSFETVAWFRNIRVVVNVEHISVAGDATWGDVFAESSNKLGILRSTVSHFDVFSLAAKIYFN